MQPLDRGLSSARVPHRLRGAGTEVPGARVVARLAGVTFHSACSVTAPGNKPELYEVSGGHPPGHISCDSRLRGPHWGPAASLVLLADLRLVS